MSKFVLPSPNFNKKPNDEEKKPVYLTPSGMTLLPREKQPPPMYGPRGATVPAKYLNENVEDTVNPENEVEYCEGCEMELKSLKDLRRHCAQHEPCPIESCTFKGHPTVMDAHIEILHADCLFGGVKKISSPEEIAAWREERKRKYPTLENVMMRQRAQEERFKRGERLNAGQDRFGHVEDRKRARVHQTGSDFKRKAKQNTTKSCTEVKVKRSDVKNTAPKPSTSKFPQLYVPVKQPESEDICAGISMFRGTSKLKDYKHIKPKKTQNVLTFLLGVYGSDSSSDDDSEEEGVLNTSAATKIEASYDVNKRLVHVERTEEKPSEQDPCAAVTKDKSNILIQTSDEGLEKASTQRTSIVRNTIVTHSAPHESSDEGPEEAPIDRNSNVPDEEIPTCSTSRILTADDKVVKPNKSEEEPNSAAIRRSQSLRRRSGLDLSKARLRKQNTMLEKLLESEIRHERNVLLQCVRFVVANNFFGIGSENKAADNSTSKEGK